MTFQQQGVEPSNQPAPRGNCGYRTERDSLRKGPGVKNNICGKVNKKHVLGRLELYPMANYGAVEIGVHRFHHPRRQNTESVGKAKFIHLCQYKDGVGKTTRVIGFDHHALTR